MNAMAVTISIVLALFFTPPQTTATIAGQVLWADGPASAGTRVSAISIWENEGWKEPSVLGEKVAASVVTDANGRYRIENIAPGRYHVVTGPVSLPNYGADAAALDSPHVVKLTAGAAVENINFAMVRNPDKLSIVPGRMLTITGKLGMKPWGTAGGGVFVLAPNSDGTITKWWFRRNDPGRRRGSRMVWWPLYDVLRPEAGAVAEMINANETVTITGTEVQLRYDLNANLKGFRMLTPSDVTRGGRQPN